MMIGIIGGSGFYDFLEAPESKEIKTNFGPVRLEEGYIGDKQVFFIPRHGKEHSIIPSNINSQANFAAISELEPDYIVTTNAVGSLHQDIPPGTFALPTDILDMTKGRTMPAIDRNAPPFDPHLLSHIRSVLTDMDVDFRDDMTLVVTNGPRFETPAEISAYRTMGADLVGMTSSPEVFYAMKCNIPYASLAIVSNLAAGLQSQITEEEVFELFEENIDRIKDIFTHIIRSDWL